MGDSDQRQRVRPRGLRSILLAASPFVRGLLGLCPLLLVYVVVVLLFSSDSLQGDERGYVGLATNLTHGYFSPARVSLWWGPGYPLILAPFAWLKLPWLAARMMNGLFLFGAAACFYGTMSLYVNRRLAFLFAYLIGLFPPALRQLHLLYTESFVYLLFSLIILDTCLLFRKKNKWRYIILNAVLFAYLALTKVFFGYVLLALLLLCLVMYVILRSSHFFRGMVIAALALLLCFPYLAYTYSLTGKVFYWGTSGGLQLYWMSTPYEEELGDWLAVPEAATDPHLVQNHGAFFSQLSSLDEVERDGQLMKQALSNIAQAPVKYAKNWVANIGRLLFSYPFSYSPHKMSTFFFLIPNMFVIVLAVLCLYPTLIRYKSIPAEIYALLILFIVSFFGSSLLSAYARQFTVLVPIIALWVFFVLANVLRIEVRK